MVDEPDKYAYILYIVKRLYAWALGKPQGGDLPMDTLQTVKNWIGALTEIGLMLLAFAIVAAVLIGPTLPFFGSVVTNLVNLIGDLGKAGLVGLFALGVIMWLFANRRMA